MKVEVITSLSELPTLEDDWRRLEANDASGGFYSSHRWVKGWCEARAEDPATSMRILVARHNGRVVGIAPLALTRGTRADGQVVERAVWASHGDYLDLLLDPGAPASTVCKYLVDHLLHEIGPDALRLSNIPHDSQLLHWLLRSPHNPDVTPWVENPYIDLRDYAGLDDFEARSLPAKTRKYRNKLLRETGVSFRAIDGADGDLLDRMAEVHVAEKEHLVARGRTERHSLYEDPRRLSQVRRVFDTDAVTFGYEDSEGRLVGYRTCWREGRRLLSWNSAYRPEYEDYRLGKVLQYDILDHLFTTGAADIFDLGAGRYPWKFEWTSRFTSSYRWLRRAAPARKQRGSDRTSTKKPALGPPAGSVPPTASRPTGAHALKNRTLGPARAARQLVRRATRPPAVFYVPHPDDETIFMGGSIARASRERRVLLVALTRGGASRARSRLARYLNEAPDVDTFMSARADELRAAAHELGVPGRDIRWHDLPDGALTPEAVLDIIRAVEAEHPGASHRTMSYADPHRDHAAAGEALRSAHRDGVVEEAVFHLPIPLVSTKWGDAVSLSRPDVEAKRAALRAYQVWHPRSGRFAIGHTSVTDLIHGQLHRPVERTHGPEWHP